MENKKYGWSTKRNSFERYYYNQLNRFKNATNLFSDDNLTEKSNLEEISTIFDELIDFLEVAKNNRSTRHNTIPKRLLSDHYKYLTAEGIKRESALKNLEEVIKKEGFLPIDIKPTENKILVIDINYLPSEYKSKGNVDETRETLEINYGCKVLLIDGSKINTQGLSNNYSPAYFI